MNSKSHSDESRSIEINPLFKKALDVMEHSSQNVFITGRAGTGKSTLLSYFRSHTEKEVVVLAPTGVAALNVQGQTIHSFFRFKPDITLDKVKRLSGRNRSRNIYQKIEAIIIDEISMVRADILDCMDQFMRINGKNENLPFGGVQMIFFGDLYQLPPVVSSKERETFKRYYPIPYFFGSNVFKNFPMELIELEKIYRQKDLRFIELLNAIRNNSASEKHLEMVNKRLDPAFEPHAKDFFIQLTPTNALAEEINQAQLLKLKGKFFSYEGEKEGDFSDGHLPTKIDLQLKIGAQVMMLNNDAMNRWVNGSVGQIVDINSSSGENDIILVKLNNGDLVEVSPYTWELFHFSYDEEAHKLTSDTVGSFTQYPMMLAWAITIHKSQGKTFDRLIIDIGSGTFAHGQMYVALSRCTSLEGIILKKPVQKRHIFVDWRVVSFVTRYQYKISEANLPLEQKMRLIQKAIRERQNLQITYLKANDEKSERTIRPFFVGELTFEGKTFTGMQAYDSIREEERTFRVDRILEMSLAEKEEVPF
ncbi:MAG: AAA family ATPase [Chlamydiae bacterium]|nr:AAA family ATPase [Chlamydiota bacterium]